MQQIEIYLKGERDYKKIVGGTGPLVYPGAHVWIYKQLYRLTDQGRDIQRAQYIFALLYLLTLGIVIQCYRKAKVRNLHVSIQMLKLIKAGPTVCLPSAHPEQETAQHLHAAVLQRLLCCAWPVGCDLLLPAKSVASRQLLLHDRSQCQDEFAVASPGNGHSHGSSDWQ